jgi:acyl-CoA thioesterase-1
VARRRFNGALLAAGALALAPVSAGAQPAPAKRLLVLGDSLTAGYGLPPGQGFVPKLQAALGPQVAVLDGGVSGDTSAGGLARLDWMLGDKPTHALVELGANDGLRGIDPVQMEANLDQIVTRLKEAGVKVMLAGMYAPPNLGKAYADAFAGVYPRLAKKHDVPLYAFFLEGVAADRSLNQGDGIHPNEKGVAIIVERLAPELRRFLETA